MLDVKTGALPVPEPKDNWQIAQGYLPDEILELYKRGDYANPIRKIDGSKGSIYDPRLKELSQKNAGKFDIDEKGTVVDKSTGTRPPVIIGWPEDQFVAVLQSFKRRERDNQVMQTMTSRLSDEEMLALAAYFGSLPVPVAKN